MTSKNKPIGHNFLFLPEFEIASFANATLAASINRISCKKCFAIQLLVITYYELSTRYFLTE